MMQYQNMIKRLVHGKIIFFELGNGVFKLKFN